MSPPTFNPADYRLQQRRTYAHWDAALFERLLIGPAAELHGRLADANGDQHVRAVVRAYVTMIQEGIGRALVQNGPTERPGSVLEHCLVHLVPAQLPDCEPGERVGLLATVWNICEGLSRQPGWVGQYALSRIGELPSVQAMDAFLVQILDPVLAPRESSWSGPFRTQVLDPRPIDDEFLPGRLFLAAPAVLCIEDRLRSGQLGVLLQENQRSRWLGPLEKLPQHPQSGGLPRLDFSEDTVTINGSDVPVSLLGRVHQWACSAAGFVIVSAENSQRIWIVESP